MKELTLPASCVSLTEQEQLAVMGGGELSDALGDFFSNLHLGDFVLGSSFVAISFTFVPLLLFNVFKVAFGVAQSVSNSVNSLFTLKETTQAQLLKAAEKK